MWIWSFLNMMNWWNGDLICPRLFCDLYHLLHVARCPLFNFCFAKGGEAGGTETSNRCTPWTSLGGVLGEEANPHIGQSRADHPHFKIYVFRGGCIPKLYGRQTVRKSDFTVWICVTRLSTCFRVGSVLLGSCTKSHNGKYII